MVKERLFVATAVALGQHLSNDVDDGPEGIVVQVHLDCGQDAVDVVWADGSRSDRIPVLDRRAQPGLIVRDGVASAAEIAAAVERAAELASGARAASH